MEHPYFRQFHDPNDEPVAEPIDFESDGDFSVEQWRQMVWKEMEDFRGTRGRERQQAAAEWYRRRQNPEAAH